MKTRTRSHVRVVVSAVMCAVAAGCVTATSRVGGNFAESDFSIDPISMPWQAGNGGARGLTYFLPTRLVTLEVITTAKDIAKLKSDVEKGKKAKEGAETAKKEADDLQKAKQAILDELKLRPQSSGRDEAIKQAEAALELAKASAAVSAKALETATTSLGVVELALAAAEAAPDGCTYTATLKSGSLVADTRRIFRLNPSHSWLRDDKGTLKVTTSGLLSSTDIKATDRTGDILVDIAGASRAGSYNIMSAEQITDKTKAEICAQTPPFKMTFDPLDVGVHGTMRADIELQKRELPFLVHLTPLVATNPIANEKMLPVAGTEIPGVAYRVETPMMMNLYRYDKKIDAPDAAKISAALSGNDAKLVEASILSLPQAGPVGFVPMRSSAFVERISNAEFENGMLKTWTYDQPSEVLEFVRLPVKVAKALISVPAELLSVKIDLSSKEASMVDKDRLALEAQLKNQQLVACVAAAGGNAEKAAECLK